MNSIARTARRVVVAACIAQLPVISAGAQATPGAAAPPTTVLRAARMVDPKSGTTMENPVVVIRAGRIVSVGSNAAIPSGARVTDLGNVTLLPGLIDAHTHLLQNYRGALGGDDPNMLMTVATMSTAKRALLGAKMGREDLEAQALRAVADEGRPMREQLVHHDP